MKILVYVRRQDELLESWWNQTVKHGISESNVMPWEEYLTVYPRYINLNYYAVLKAAARKLGKENIIVRRFHRDFFEGGTLQSDFLHAIGLDLTEDFQVPQSLNFKMSENFCEIKRIINGMPEVELKDRWRYEDILRDLSELSCKENPCSMFSEEEAADFMKKYESSNQKLYKTFLADGKPLFSGRKYPAKKWERDNPQMLTDLVRFVIKVDVERHREMEAEREGLTLLKNLFHETKHLPRHLVRKMRGKRHA